MSKTFTIRLPDQLHAQAVEHVDQNKTTLADLIRVALSEKMSGVTLTAVAARIAEQNQKLDKLLAIAEEEVGVGV